MTDPAAPQQHRASTAAVEYLDRDEAMSRAYRWQNQDAPAIPPPLTVVFGFDPREALGAAVFQYSVQRRATGPVRFVPLVQGALRASGLYTRPQEIRDGQIWDLISDAPCSTEFSLTRFLTPWLAGSAEWVLFCDGADMLAVDDIGDLFAAADPRFAVQVVKHDHQPAEKRKFLGATQTRYERKNWSSLMLVNTRHPANARLTLEMVNTLPGRDLHALCWLQDDEIGDLPAEWNALVDVNDATPAKLLHWTLGGPALPGYERAPYADLWRRELALMLGKTAFPTK